MCRRRVLSEITLRRKLGRLWGTHDAAVPGPEQGGARCTDVRVSRKASVFECFLYDLRT